MASCGGRADYYGDWIDSYVDGSKMRYYPRQLRRRRLHRSAGVVLMLITLVLGIVVSIYIIRFTIRDKVGKIGAQVLASMANAIQIQALNHVYSRMAVKYTEKENHRCDLPSYPDCLPPSRAVTSHLPGVLLV